MLPAKGHSTHGKMGAASCNTADLPETALGGANQNVLPAHDVLLIAPPGVGVLGPDAVAVKHRQGFFLVLYNTLALHKLFFLGLVN